MLDIQPNDYLQGYFEEEEQAATQKGQNKDPVDEHLLKVDKIIAEVSNEDSILSDLETVRDDDVVIIDREIASQ